MALGLGGSMTGRQDPFYTYNQFKPDDGYDWTKTPFIGGPSGYLEQNQDATYNRFLSKMGVGLGQTTPYAEWLRRQYDATRVGYKSALAENPMLMYQDYLKGITPQSLRAQFMRRSPYQRGLNISRYAGPTRTISDL